MGTVERKRQGQTAGAAVALHGVIAVYAVPTLNGPVMTSTVSALASVVYRAGKCVLRAWSRT